MKRKPFGLLCVCLLLSGCNVNSQTPPATEVPTIELPVTETQAVTKPLLEQGIPQDANGILMYIPNETLEGMHNPEMRLLGNGLLLSEYWDGTLVLRHISLEDGALLSAAEFPAGSDTKLYIGSGEIGLCDRESGLVSILDENFRVQRTYDVPCEGDDWCLNSELDTLYIFDDDRGLCTRNLETGEEYWLLDNGYRVTCKGNGSGYILFDYTDRTDKKTYCLNLSTATLETLPVDGAIFRGTRQGETWLLQTSDGDMAHILVSNESALMFTWTDSPVRLLTPRRHLLVTDPSARNLSLYSTDGAFLSQCSLPQNSNAFVGADFIWSGYWSGYFFTDFMNSSCRLMFWNVNVDTTGENLQMAPLENSQPSQPVVEASLYERAAQLSKHFGVDVRIAEQCSLDYTHYESFAVIDPVYIRSALDVIEETLAQYPEGFFRQLTYDSIESIRIELVGSLFVKENVSTHPSHVNAFAQNNGTHYLVALDCFSLQQKTLYHEFSHIIDKKLEWDSTMRADALYSEESWMALQPDGFDYAFSYTEVPEELLQCMESGYFVTEYALTFPTEDRATLFEAAMNDYSWDFEPGSGRRAKLQYYADCIRGCFDTEGWPEITLWEQVLQ